MPISLIEFKEWKERNKVTLAVQDTIRERVENLKNQLVSSTDRDFDMIVKGMIRAYNDMLDIEPDMTDEEESKGEQ